MSQHHPPSKCRFNRRGGRKGRAVMIGLWYLPWISYIGKKKSLVCWNTRLAWLQAYFQFFCFKLHLLILFSCSTRSHRYHRDLLPPLLHCPPLSALAQMPPQTHPKSRPVRYTIVNIALKSLVHQHSQFSKAII